MTHAPGARGVSALRCGICERLYSATPDRYVCDDCGPRGTLEVILDLPMLGATLDPERLARSPGGMESFEGLLPVPAGSLADLPRVGPSPLLAAPRLARSADFGRVWIKDDGRLPTGSLKDRATLVAVALARARGERVIAAASTGNAASSLAGLAAAAGLEAAIFVPANAPAAKLAQCVVFGAQLERIDAPYAEVWRTAVRVTAERGWYPRSCSYNPYLIEGKKTVAYEIARDLGWRVPDWVAVGVGDGDIITALEKGFRELLELGWIERLPRLLGVQAEGLAPLVRAARAGLARPEPVSGVTVADSIAVGDPGNGVRALKAVAASGGAWMPVEDASIREAQRQLARLGGVFAEPAGATPWAGLRRAREKGLIGPEAEVLVLVTGNGLKDPAAVLS